MNPSKDAQSLKLPQILQHFLERSNGKIKTIALLADTGSKRINIIAMSGPEGEKYSISLTDYIILVVSVLIVLAIAVWTAFKNKSTTQDFFTARASIGPFPVAMSFLSTFISGFMIMAFAGEMYGYGIEFFMAIVGGAIGIVICTFMNLKVFYDLELATIYEYFELRYKSYSLRFVLMIFQLFLQIATMGIAGTGPPLVLAAITPVDIRIYCVISGILCAFYATVGGMRGVIWTDTFMMIIMFAGMIAVIIVGWMQLGISTIWRVAEEGGRTVFFNFNLSLYQRQNSILAFFHGFLLFGKMFGTTQISLQRAMSLKSFTDYKISVAILVGGFLVLNSVIFATGFVAYAFYAGCDPISRGIVNSVDQVLPHLISDKLNSVPGIAGIFLASMICAGISTVSSQMNSFANLFYGDILCKFKPFQKLNQKRVLFICKTITMLTALPTIALSIIATKSQGMLPIAMSINGILLAPVFGVFFLALLFPMSRLIGVVTGFIASLALLIWIAIGKAMYGHPDKLLPLSTELCEDTILNGTLHMNDTQSYTVDLVEPEVSIYDVSYTFFSIFGTITCLGVGLIVSFIKGPEKTQNIPKELISPVIRWFYYKDEPIDEDKKNHNAKSVV